MNISEDRVAVTRALEVALIPIIDLCLTVGLTSPELESMLRAVFVRRAIVKLPSHRSSGKPASDVRVGLALGLHRNEVRRIRSSKEELSMERRQRRRRTERLVAGWSTDPRYFDSGGHPLDLPLLTGDRAPSFRELAAKYLPGVSSGTAIRELRRQGIIQVLPDEVIRLRASAARTTEFNPSSVAQAGKRLQRLAATVFHNIAHTNSPIPYKEINNLKIDPRNFPLIRRTLDRRIQVFLEGIERELGTGTGSRRRIGDTRLGVTAFVWKDE
jgi:uncharacterized protein DUF6502